MCYRLAPLRIIAFLLGLLQRFDPFLIQIDASMPPPLAPSVWTSHVSVRSPVVT